MRNLILAVALVLPSLASAGPKRPEGYEEFRKIMMSQPELPPVSEGAALTPGAVTFITGKDEAVEVVCLTMTGDIGPVISYLKGVDAPHGSAGPEIAAILSRRQARFLSRFPGVSLMSVPAVDKRISGPLH